MGIADLLEVYYDILRHLGYDKAEEVLREIHALPIRIISEISVDTMRKPVA